MDLGLKGKVAIVLAASKGLGRASAAALAAEGAQVVIGARNEQVLREAAEQMRRESGSQVLAVPTDVTKPDDLAAIVEAATREFGQIDVLVNNAGGPPPGTFEMFNDAQWEAAFELSLLSVVRLIRLVLPHMRKQGSGRIINIVGPGRILTDRIRQVYQLDAKKQQGISEEEALKDAAREIPMGRIGKPEELGALVAFLASEQAAYITGTTIQVDGGVTRSLL